MSQTHMEVILADNQPIFRAGVARVLGTEPHIAIAVQTSDREQLLVAVDQVPNAIVLFAGSLRAELPELVTRVRAAGSRVICFAENEESPKPYLTSGVDSVLFRGVTGNTLLETLHRVASGESQTAASFSPAPPDEIDSVGERVLERLTPKELQIVSLVVEGQRNKEIAERLSCKEQVVKNYMRTIFDKTGVSDRLELALFTVHHPALAKAAAETSQALRNAS
jgi:DNA-binding NarL/FixJ family response regulator